MASRRPTGVVLAPCGECPEDLCDRCQNCKRLEVLPVVIKRIRAERKMAGTHGSPEDAA